MIRDNIRILQTTLDNWGDETKGIVKYHMENTDFEVLSKKYELEEELDEEGEVKDEATSSTDEETNNDFKQGKRSLQQMASKETLTVLKTLFKVNSDGSIPKNRLGFPERADFGKVFAIVANTIGGIRNRYDAYDRLVEQAKNFPEIKQLVETKFPNPRTKMNKHTMRLSVQFFQDFGKPQIDYWQLYAYHDPIYTNKINYQVKESDLATDNVLNGWVNGFASAAKSKYVDISAQNIRTLNLENILATFFFAILICLSNFFKSLLSLTLESRPFFQFSNICFKVLPGCKLIWLLNSLDFILLLLLFPSPKIFKSLLYISTFNKLLSILGNSLLKFSI